MADELATLDATAHAALVRRGEVTPLDLVEAAIARAQRVNPALNAIVTPLYDQARAAARGTLPDGPFRGVPFLLKDLVASYAGARMTGGSAFLRDYVPDHDSELVTRFRRAGLVIIGKTNTPEFGILPTTEPLLFGPCRNPWDTERMAGGSSGGSAAAVAAGIVPMAHANDGGGSIRIPASCCGLFGMKPTRGRTSLGPDFGDIMGGLVVEHAVTRSVRDSAALLDAVSGPFPGDPYCAPAPVRPFLEEVGADPGRLRIAFTTTAPSGARIDEECVRAVHDAAKLCESLGHHVEEAAPEINGALMVDSFLRIWRAGTASAVQAMAFLTGRTPSPELFEPLTWALYEQGRQVSAPAYLMAQTVLQGLSRQIGGFMLSYDAWLTPTVAEPPLPLGSFEPTPANPLAGFERAVEFVPFTPMCNLSGQPAMSLPLHWTAGGLPVGTHFIGRFGDEATLFRLASQIEAARPWKDRQPRIFAGPAEGRT
ncbi:MAG: amidase [Acidobacteriota bacterium]|nr:amidase [Acidobacteriota bacterium]